MSPEAVNYISIAEAALERSERNFLAEIYEDAARNAYLAALNATRAVVFFKTGEFRPKLILERARNSFI